MIQIKHHHISGSLAIFVLGLFFFAQNTLALGISPAIILVENVLPNMHVEKTMTISRFKAESDATFAIKVGGDAGQFITLPDGETAFAPKGEHQVKYRIMISPGNAAEGEYRATVTVTETDHDAAKGADAKAKLKTRTSTGSRNLAGAEANITVQVTNKEVEAFELDQVVMGDTEIGKPVGVAFNFINKGNVATKIGKMHVLIQENFTGEQVYDADISADNLKLVEGFTSQEQNLLTEALLKIGYYKAEVKFYNRKGDPVPARGKFVFQVWPEGTLAQEGELAGFSSDKGGDNPAYKLGEFVKFIGSFHNKGSVHLKPALTVEVFKDGTRIELLKTDPIFAPVKRVVEFEASYQPKETGEYTAKAYVAFGAGKTQTLETKFHVPVQGWILILGVLGGGTLLVLLVLILWKRHKRAGAPAPAPVPSMPIGAWCPMHKN